MATKTKKTDKVTVESPQSMDQLMKSVGYTFKGFKRGEQVVGKVVEVTSRTVYIDIGGKAEAIVSEKEYEMAKDYFRAMKPGDEVTGTVLITENDAGQVILSLRRAASDNKWKAFEQALADDSPIAVKGKEVTKGGLLVEIDGVFGFIPSSQLGHEADADSSALIGKTIMVKVIEVDRSMNRLVLSERAVSEAADIEKRKTALTAVKVGGEYEGTVVGMVPFGAFIEISVGKGAKVQGLEGLVHISEITWDKVDDVSKVLKEGEKVKVQVIGIDEENGKLALSMKRLSSDPWLIAISKYNVDSKHRGVVSKIVPYGILVKLERGIEGLIHASKMPVDKAFKEGDEVDVFVESVDLDKRRLSLGVVLTTVPVGYK